MSGWGGWGNWISSTVNTVVKEFGEAMKDLDEDQKPQVSTDASVASDANVVVESSASSSSSSDAAVAAPKTRKVVADGAAKEEIEITDGNEDEAAEKSSDAATGAAKPEERSSPVATTATRSASKPEANKGEDLKEREDAFKKEEEMLDTFENALDQGAAFLTTTTSFLGGLLQQGIDIVKNSEEVAFISVKAKSVANTSKKVSAQRFI